MQIEGVLHEFSSLPGVLEDVTDIVLNVKSIGLRMHGEGPKRIRLRAQGPGEVRAGAIEAGHDIEILNPDLVICTLDSGARISMEMTVEHGKGYLPGTQNRPEDAPIGLIPVDALFSPVRKVSYRVENTRVGQVTDYDSLSMRVETNGAMSPEDAVALAARILQDQLQLFINFEEPRHAVEKDIAAGEPLINKNLLRKVDELELLKRINDASQKSRPRLQPHLVSPSGDVRKPRRRVAEARADSHDAAQGEGSAPDCRAADHAGQARRAACPAPGDCPSWRP